jgi:hypothetical protein
MSGDLQKIEKEGIIQNNFVTVGPYTKPTETQPVKGKFIAYINPKNLPAEAHKYFEFSKQTYEQQFEHGYPTSTSKEFAEAFDHAEVVKKNIMNYKLWNDTGDDILNDSTKEKIQETLNAGGKIDMISYDATPRIGYYSRARLLDKNGAPVEINGRKGGTIIIDDNDWFRSNSNLLQVHLMDVTNTLEKTIADINLQPGNALELKSDTFPELKSILENGNFKIYRASDGYVVTDPDGKQLVTKNLGEASQLIAKTYIAETLNRVPDDFEQTTDEKIVIKSEGKTKGERNNNPFNVEKTKDVWHGSTGSDGRFVKFNDLEFGVRAGLKNLYNGYFSQDLTLAELIAKYAPKTENDTAAYIDDVVQKTGVEPDEIPSEDKWLDIAAAILLHENGKEIADASTLKQIAKKYNLQYYIND